MLSPTKNKGAAPIVLEETFLLVKPDASHLHAEILAALHEAQFHVQMRQFTVTRPMAEALVSRFPCVMQTLQRERGGAAGSPGRRTRGSGTSADGATNDCDASSSAFSHASPFSSMVRLRTGEATHSEHHVQIMKLAKRDVSGLDGSSVALSGSGGGTASSAGSAAALSAANVSHLLCGTCLALAIAADDAVEKAKALAGPEDPALARHAAPLSLRARLGTDLLRNAVFVAESASDAAFLVERVFGYVPTPEALTHPAEPLTRSQSRPSLDVLLAAGDDPLLALQDAVDLEQAHLSLATVPQRAHQPGLLLQAAIGATIGGNIQPRVPSAAHEGPHRDERGLSGRQEVVAEMARMLREERLVMQQQAKMLRIRELDLLLREKQLEGAMASHPHSSGPPQPLLPALAVQSAAPSPSPPTTGRRLSRRGPGLPAVSFGSKAAASVGPPPIALESDQIDSVIANPGKLQLLFQRLDRAGTGKITSDEFMAFYRNSPCLWKVGVENHEAVVQRTLPTLGISSDTFALAVLQLIR
jgi:nucleoside diphosphate kinase